MADSVYRGTVTRVTSAGVFLLIPALGARVEYGPCQTLLRPELLTGTATLAGSTSSGTAAGTAQTTDSAAAYTATATGSAAGASSPTGDASTGTAHTHPVNGTSHTHGVPSSTHAHGVPSHTHPVTVTTDSGQGQHTHPMPALAAGHKVLVTTVGGIRDDLVILGRL